MYFDIYMRTIMIVSIHKHLFTNKYLGLRKSKDGYKAEPIEILNVDDSAL